MNEQAILALAVGAFCVKESNETIKVGQLHESRDVLNFASRAGRMFNSLISDLENAHDLVHEIRSQDSNDNHDGEPSPLKYDVTFTCGFMSNDLGEAIWRHTVVVRRIA